jgi:hypothetical protein
VQALVALLAPARVERRERVVPRPAPVEQPEPARAA